MKLLFTICIFIVGVAHAQKYKRVYIDEKKAAVPLIEKSSKVEVEISNAIIEALGETSLYKGAGKRVMSISIDEQVAGEYVGGSVAQINYYSDPALIGSKFISKDGLFIDAERAAEEVVKSKAVRNSKIKAFIFRAHAIVRDGSASEPMMKIEISLQALKRIKWASMDGVNFEKFIRANGKVSYGSYLVNNGGQYLTLKQELLDL